MSSYVTVKTTLEIVELRDVEVVVRGAREETPPILQSIDFQVAQGESVGIVGGSGSGKSTLLRLIAGVVSEGLHLQRGAVRVLGKNIVDSSAQEREEMYGKSLALVAQSLGESMTPHLTVLGHFRDTVGKDVAPDRVLRSLTEVGLDGDGYLRRFPHQLSGGERQRVLLALALVRSPKLLLLDEPTSALDVSIAADVLKTIKDLQARHGFALVCVSHDLGVVRQIADRLVVMAQGQIVESGETTKVLRQPGNSYTQKLVDSIPKLESRVRQIDKNHGDILLESRDLTISRGRTTRAVDSLSFEIRKGEVVGIIGESGSGKSSLLSAICGLVPIDSGDMRFGNGQDLATTMKRRSPDLLSSIQMVFQNPDDSLNPKCSVAQSLGRYTNASRDEMVAVLSSVGLDQKFLSRQPNEMSGGEKQRVALARALLASPELLLLDEITSALDVTVQAAVLKTLSDLQKDLGVAMILVSHDIALIASFADKLIVLRNGRLIEQGTSAEIVDSPRHEYTRKLVAIARQKSAA
ncbi:MAG: ABC transporter ATP-binding protein [Actinomycetota bacterium]